MNQEPQLQEPLTTSPTGIDGPEVITRTRIGLDVDGVIANFSDAFILKARELGLGQYFPDSWKGHVDWDFGLGRGGIFKAVWREIEEDPIFWLRIPTHSERPLYRPEVYVTARPVPSIVTEAWLGLNGFPKVPVVTVPVGHNKADAFREFYVDLFIDDKPSNVLELRNAGINAVLLDRPWNGEATVLPRTYSINTDINGKFLTVGENTFAREIVNL